METKNARTFRMSAMTERQLAGLSERLGTSLTETLTVAIDRMYREEIKMNKLSQDEQEQAAQIARFVIENGRVIATDGETEPESLAVEVSFEASERGIPGDVATAMGEYAAQNI